MPQEQALAIDHRRTDATLSVMPNPPLLTSQKSGWSSIHFAHFPQPALELPEFISLQHIITAVVTHQTVEVEFVVEGRLQTM